MSDPVTLNDLQKMHQMAAALVLADRIYLPIFERIERELETFGKEEDAVPRARAVAGRHKAAA